MKILLVSPRPLHPVRHGHVSRTRQVAEALVERGHRVRTLEIAKGPLRGALDPGLARLGIERRLEQWSGEAYRMPLQAVRGWLQGLSAQQAIFPAARWRARIEEALRGVDGVILTLGRLAHLASACRDLPVAIDLVDSLALQAECRAKADRVWLRPFWKLEARRLLEAERYALSRARNVWLVSGRDLAWLTARAGPEWAGQLLRVPLAVDATHRRSGSSAPAGPGEPPEAPVSRSFRIVISGNLGYFPTREGLRWWFRKLWPEIRRRIPGVRLLLAGSRIPWNLRARAPFAATETISEPSELAPLLASADVAAVPLRTGSGVPMKFLEAWAAGVPVVATPWAAAGAGAEAGQDHWSASNAAEWIEALVALRDDAHLRARLREEGWAKLARDWSRAALHSALDQCEFLHDGGYVSSGRSEV